MKKGWKIKRLADVLELQNGYAFDSKAFNPTDGLPLIRIRSLKAGVETETRFSGDYEKKYVVKAGDLLIGMDGEFGCYEWKGEPALLNQRVCRLQGFTGELIPRFLFYGVNDYLKAIEDVTGYTTVKHISSKQILEIEFPVPPLAEQQRIVGLLDEAFEGLATAKANAEKNLQNARALFESHLNSVFTKRGEGWQTKTLGELCAIELGRTPARANASFWDETRETSNVWLSIADLLKAEDNVVVDSKEYVSDKGAAICKLVPKGTLLVSFKLTLGRLAFAGRDLFTNEAIAALTIFSARELSKEFLFYCLTFFDWVKAAENDVKLKGMTLNKAKLKVMPVSFPPLAEQQRIVGLLDALSEETQRLARLYVRKHAALEALKKSLLHQAFTGEL